VKTTPKPNATKNNRGELGPELCCELAVGDAVGAEDIEELIVLVAILIYGADTS
jgi:hypothetical protein